MVEETLPSSIHPQMKSRAFLELNSQNPHGGRDIPWKLELSTLVIIIKEWCKECELDLPTPTIPHIADQNIYVYMQ